MKKRLLVLLLFVVFLSSNIFAGSVDNEMKKITHYAEEYETGNIDYVALQVYLSSARGNLNELLGATGMEAGGIIKQEEIKKILGEPTEETKWVWVESEEHELKLDDYIPAWRKIIFDGKKIQIRLEAYPSIFKKKFKDSEEFSAFSEGEIIYRLHFGIDFKKPEDQIDILGKINNVKKQAEIFNTDSSGSNAESLAKESVNAEKVFQNFFRQNSENCEDIMKTIFGSENKRETQKILLNEISFFEGENFDTIIRMEMCDECEWNWINLDMRFEGKGNFKYPDEKGMPSEEKFKNFDEGGFMNEAKRLIDEMKADLESGDYNSAMNVFNTLRMLNNAWNEKSNDVWDEVDSRYRNVFESMTEEERRKFDQNFGWIKQEQKKRVEVKKLRQEKYETKRAFYLELFSGYDKRDFYFTQTSFEKRLVEEFREFGQEVCDNNKDDNDDGSIDCADSQCGGKVCGKGESLVTNGNETTEMLVDFYCIAGTCQAKEETIKITESVCGNHVCEEGEKICLPFLTSCDNSSECVSTSDCGENYCPEDCSECPDYPPLNCSGKVVFSGKDSKGCLMEPVCVDEKKFCEATEDCVQPLCGVAECIIEEGEKGICEVTELKECEDAQCEDGEKTIERCSSGEEIVTGICENGIWVSLEIFCSAETSGEKVVVSEEVIGEQCVVANDCGGENDVCSNGRCVSIPEVQREEVVEEEVSEEVISEENNGEEIFEETTSEEDEREEGIVSEGEEEQEETQNEIQETESSTETETQSETESSESENSEPEESSNTDSELTGGFIFNFLKLIFGRATGSVVDEITNEDSETSSEETSNEDSENTETDTSGEDGEDSPETFDDSDNEFPENQEDNFVDEGDNQMNVCPNGECNDENYDEHRDEGRDDDDERRKDEERRREEENKKRCNEDCRRPCIEECIRESCGEELDCNVDEERKNCEGSCTADETCVSKCMKGEGDWWQEFENKQEVEKGVFQVGGGCRTSQGKTEGFIWFGGWGDPFQKIEPLKQKYYSGGEADWCKEDLENLILQRREFEKGFNQEFAKWFFETYLANAAENWEGASSGIFELYWSNVDNQMQMAQRMNCVGKKDITQLMQPNLINIEYESEFGRLQYWEELREVSMPGLDGKVTIVSPYMKIWIFPNKKFFAYEMKQSMENHEFPGSPEEKLERENQGGPTEEEREMIKQNSGFMKKIRKVSEKYGGNIDAVIQFKDFETNEIVFNLYAQINEEDILKMEPMLPEEVPREDVKIEIDFEKIYDMVYSMEKDMQGEFTESPPWDKRGGGVEKIKEVTNGIKMYFKLRSLINSAKIYPEESRKDVESLFKEFFSMMSKGEDKGIADDEEKDIGEEKGVWDSQEKITGEFVFN